MVSVKLLSKKKTKRTRGGETKTTKKRSIAKSRLQTRKSVRLSGNQTVETKVLGPVPMAYESSTNKNIPYDEISDFIDDNIEDGPQIVSLPVPKQRHAFIVDIQPDNIIIVDWGGETNKTRGLRKINGIKNKAYKQNWTTYSNFMLLLEKKFGKKIVYADLDTELADDANEKNCDVNGGGCSDYAYAYAKKYYEQKNPNHYTISSADSMA
jgi:hypothetical protein